MNINHQNLRRICKIQNNVFYAYKPLQKLLPKLTKGDLEDLRNAIASEGINKPIRAVLISDKRVRKYIVLDGVHRVKIMSELGVTDVPIEEVEVSSEEELIEVGTRINMDEKRGRQISKKQLIRKLRQQHADLSFSDFCDVVRTQYGLHLSNNTILHYIHNKANQQSRSRNKKSTSYEHELLSIAKELAIEPSELLTLIRDTILKVKRATDDKWRTILKVLTSDDMICLILNQL